MACREVEMGKQKCQSYWPPSGESAFFGAIKVTTVRYVISVITSSLSLSLSFSPLFQGT